MCLMQSPIGTDGNRAAASNDTILSVGRSLRFFYEINKFDRVFADVFALFYVGLQYFV